MNICRMIGDVHGIFSLYNEVISCGHTTLQIGDMGIGFPGDNNFKPTSKDYFINGNHDDPDKCKNYPTFLEKHGMFKNIFYCGGGFSIDRQWRIEGKSWWANEEQSVTELNAAIDLYIAQKPEIVVTHEAPAFLAHYMADNVYPPSRTALALQAMVDEHFSKIWIFGHWHLNFRIQIGDTMFICLPELAYLDVDLDDLSKINETVLIR